MSDSITQTLSFDATAALASLSQLDGSLATFSARIAQSATSLRDFNAAGNPAASMLARLATNASKANASLDTLNAAPATSSLAALGAASTATSAKVAASSKSMAAAVQSSNAASAASIGRLTTSMQLLSRIAFTQFVIRGLNTIRRGLQDTATDAAAFQRQIALIQTIDNSGQSFDQLADAVRKTSDNFNLPLLETAAGLYQTISNQVGDAAQSLEFFNEAARFAKATNSSLADSVDLLSAAQKSYGLTVEDTSRISSAFFTAIDLGRVNASELANSLGRVLPIASELGISLEETGAGLAAISVKGSGTSESITQLRAIMTAFLKPSEEMQDVLKKIGVSSAETLIHEVGLAGALRLVTAQTDGSQSAMGKLFPNVRGLAGATSLTADGLRAMANNLDEMTAKGREFASQKFLQATDTDAERLTKEIGKLKNALTVDFGQAVLKAGADLSQLVGGADAVTKAVKVAAPAIVGLGGNLITLRGSLIASEAGATGLAKALRGLAAIELAVGVGKSLGDFLEAQRTERTLAPIQALAKSDEEGLATFKRQLAEATDVENKASQERLQRALQITRELNRTYLAQAGGVNGLAKSHQDAAREISESQKRVVDAIAQLDDQRFDFQSNRFDKITQALRAQQRAQELAGKAASELARADTAAERDAALAVFSRADAYAKLAASTANQTNNTTLQAQAENTLESVFQKRIDAERQFQRSQQQTSQRASNILRGVPGVDQLAAISGKPITTPDQLSQSLIAGEKRIEALRAQINQAKAAQQQAANLNNEINSIFGQIGQREGARQSVGSINAPALNQQFDATLGLFREVQKDGKVTEGELRILIDLTNKLRENALGGSVLSADRLTQRLGFSSSIELLDQALQRMQQLSKAPAVDTAPLEQELQRLNSALNSFSAQLDSGVVKSAAIASNFERAAQAAVKVKIPDGQAQVPAFARGGLVRYYADGGFTPRGTDTIPAMLSPGEFVVNAASTRKFYAQLVAMNSGQQPIYRAEGGPTNNVTFSGDIHVVENGHGRDTARQLMGHVQRELRRKTGRL